MKPVINFVFESLRTMLVFLIIVILGVLFLALLNNVFRHENLVIQTTGLIPFIIETLVLGLVYTCVESINKRRENSKLPTSIQFEQLLLLLIGVATMDGYEYVYKASNAGIVPNIIIGLAICLFISLLFAGVQWLTRSKG